MFLFSLVRRIKNWGVIYNTARDKKEKCLTKALQFILQTQLFSINLADNRSKNPISYDLTTRFKIAKKNSSKTLRLPFWRWSIYHQRLRTLENGPASTKILHRPTQYVAV